MADCESDYDTEAHKRALDEVLKTLGSLRIPPKQLKLSGAPTGRGGFGEVVLGSWSKPAGWWSYSTLPVAVKRIRPSQHAFVRLALRFVQELKVWSKFQHPNVLTCLGFNIDLNGGGVFFVSPYLSRGNILSRLRTDATISIDQRKKWVHDATSGLAYLHGLTPPVIHGNLKSENILLDDTDSAVLCDFGLSTVAEESMSTGLTTSDGFKGSLRWCSPELLNGEKRTTFSDMWAWALCVLEIATGRLPYHKSCTEFAIYGRILGQCPTGEEYPELPSESRIWETLEKCFKKDPAERPSADECLAHVPYPPPPVTLSTVRTWESKDGIVEVVSRSGRLVLLSIPDENDPDRSSGVIVENLVSGDRVWIMRKSMGTLPLLYLSFRSSSFSDDELTWAWWNEFEGRLYIYDVQGPDPQLVVDIQLWENPVFTGREVYFMGAHPNRRILLFHQLSPFSFGLTGLSSILSDTQSTRMTYTPFPEIYYGFFRRLSPTNQYVVMQQRDSGEVGIFNTASFFPSTISPGSPAAFPEPIFTVPNCGSRDFWISDTAYAVYNSRDYDSRGYNIWDVESRTTRRIAESMSPADGTFLVGTASWLVYQCDRMTFHFLHTPTILASPGPLDLGALRHPPHFRAEREDEDENFSHCFQWDKPEFVIFHQEYGPYLAKRMPELSLWW